MKFYKRTTALAQAAILLFAAFSAFSQKPRVNFNRPQTFDVQNYTIRASFDRVNNKVFGDTTVSLKPLTANFRTVELDAVDMAFDSVKLDPAGTDLLYKVLPGKIVVMLDRAYAAGELISIRLRYTATPVKGVYFVAAETNANTTEHSAQIWSQGEAEEARHWFPSFDFPSDKATTEEYITAEQGETVVGNGEFLGKTENADTTTTWHYKMSVPHSTYLVSFVIGKYSRVEGSYKNIPLGYYVYPGKEATAHRAFDGTKDIMAAYETLTGVAFPYNKYDQTVVARFQFGGMENITATTMSDDEIFFADVDLLQQGIVVDLVSHELAHSWFGDLVTCRNWAELWLNEGFATYMEAAYREKAFGHDDYMRKIRTDAADFFVDDNKNTKRQALYNLQAGNVDSLFDNSAVTYHKGGAVLYMLREQVGTEAFWRALNNYLNRHKFANVESTDLRQAMEEASGQDLSWFFHQWVYGIGAPKLNVREIYSAGTKTLKITVIQTQKPGPDVPPAFHLPMDVVITTQNGTTTQRIDITKRLDTFTIKTDAEPTEIKLDPNDKILLKAIKQGRMTTLK